MKLTNIEITISNRTTGDILDVRTGLDVQESNNSFDKQMEKRGNSYRMGNLTPEQLKDEIYTMIDDFFEHLQEDN